MHEMSLVRPMVDIVVEECERHGIAKVASIHVTIGEMLDVVEDYVPSLFRYLAKGTAAEDADVVINRVPYYVRCNDCGEIFHIDVRDKGTWKCPRCGERNYRLFSGREFRLDSIEPAEPAKNGEAA